MDDLISRQAAIDALCSECQGRCVPCKSYPCSEVETINALPSAQPEIIHCEECVYRKDNFMGDWCTCWCGWTSLDGHCHKGANKDE